MNPVHFMPNGEISACGIRRQHYPGLLQFTTHKVATTCEACQNTREFKTAIQRLPIVPEGRYRG